MRIWHLRLPIFSFRLLPVAFFFVLPFLVPCVVCTPVVPLISCVYPSSTLYFRLAAFFLSLLSFVADPRTIHNNQPSPPIRAPTDASINRCRHVRHQRGQHQARRHLPARGARVPEDPDQGPPQGEDGVAHEGLRSGSPQHGSHVHALRAERPQPSHDPGGGTGSHACLFGGGGEGGRVGGRGRWGEEVQWFKYTSSACFRAGLSATSIHVVPGARRWRAIRDEKDINKGCFPLCFAHV